MPKFHMLIGLPASGKSHVREHQLNTINSRTVSSDDIIDQMAKAADSTYNEVFPHVIDFAHKKCAAQMKDYVAKGHDIISDQTNLSKKTRANKLVLIPKHYTKIAHVIDAPPKEEHERRLSSRFGKSIPANVMKDMKASYQEPSHDEGFDEIHHYSHEGNIIKSSKIKIVK